MIEADLRREYGLTPSQIAVMSTREFIVCATGLSEQARWPAALQQVPHRLDRPEAIASVFGSYNA